MINDPASYVPSDSLPTKRNPNLVARFMNLFARSAPNMGPQVAQRETTQTGSQINASATGFDRYYTNDFDRGSIYRDVDEMDRSSEETSVVLDTIADNILTSEDGAQTSFEVIFENNLKAQQIVDDALETSAIHDKMYPWVRNTVKYGDSFCEVVINRDAQLVDLRQLPPHTMQRNQDGSGNLRLEAPRYDANSGKCLNRLGECAFQQIDPNTGNVIASFWPFQIIHTRLNHDGFSVYGRSMLRVTRLIWRKMKAEEEALIIGRLTRAYLKLIYHIDATGMSKPQRVALLEEFKNSLTQRQMLDGRRENPYSVMTDIYLTDGYVPTGGGNRQPSRTRVETIDPKNQAMTDIADVEYFHRKKLSTLRVPPAHIGFEKDVNAKATLTMQDVQYVRFLRRVQSEMSRSLRLVIETILVLNGIDPKTVEFLITWPELSAANEAAASLAEYQRAQADEIYVDLIGAIDREWVQKHRYNMTDKDIAEMNVRVDAQKKKDAQMEVQQAGAVAKATAGAAAAAGVPKRTPTGSRNGGRGATPGRVKSTTQEMDEYTDIVGESDRA